MNTVTKEEYWSIILNDPTQIGQITTEDTEFNRRINDVNLVLSNTFINSSDENLISKWETSLYIDETEGKTITERKSDILYKLCEKNYVPVSIIKRFLLNLIGDENRFVVEFIKDENKLVIHTDRAEDTQVAAVGELLESVRPKNVEVVRYNHHIEVNWRDINKYANCETTKQMYEVDPTATTFLEEYGVLIYYTEDLTSDGDFVYPLPNLKTVTNAHHVKGGFFKNVKAQHFRISLPKITAIYALFHLIKSETIEVDAPNVTHDYHAFLCMNAYNLRKFSTNATLRMLNMAFYNDTKLEEIEMDFSKAYDLSAAFYGCKLNKKTVLKISEDLPIVSGNKPVTLGIHIDLQTDAEVLAAITNAESKGWTLTVQWNGTPTSTASTMAMGSLIYAKVGEYELPDGTTERVLDWGHYVTDETGYETFRSLKSAYKYFNLEQSTEI